MKLLADIGTLSVRLRERLARPLPGLEAQLSMCPPTRGDPTALLERERNGKKAAVLILLYPLESGEVGFVLTLRQRALQAHSGQVSLPGGSLDSGETALEAALRETEEEVGVPASAPEVLGVLTDLYIPPSDFTVTPVVAALDGRPEMQRDRGEVAVVIEVPVAALMDEKLKCSARWRLQGHEVDVPYYSLAGYEVWGATAMMLAEFAALVTEILEQGED